MTLTYAYLKAREAELPARINAKRTDMASTILEVQVNPITPLDIFYSDGDARHFCCKMMIVCQRGEMQFSRLLNILPDGDHLSPFNHRDPVHGAAIYDTLKALLFELDEEQATYAAEWAAKIGGANSPVAGTAPIS
jgi:hypothetical protein